MPPAAPPPPGPRDPSPAPAPHLTPLPTPGAVPSLGALPPEPPLERGRAVAHLLATRQQWVHRRVDTLRLLGTTRLRRHVSVDFTLPVDPPLPGLLTGPDTAPARLVPLALVRKGVLVDLDVRDGAGHAVPVSTARDNAATAWGVLAAVTAAGLARSRTAAPAPLSPAVLAELATVAAGDPAEARAAVERLTGDGLPARVVAGAAARQPLLVPLLHELAASFLLTAVLPVAPGERHVVKLAYDEELVPTLGRRARLGWRPAWVLLPAPPPAAAASTHTEVHAPDGAQVTELVVHPGGLSGEQAARAAAATTTRGDVVHVRLPHGRSRTAVAVVGVRPLDTGLLPAAAVATVLTATGLLALTPALARVDESAAGTSLLLALPAIVLSQLIRRPEPRLTSRVLLGVRTLLAACALVPLTAALVVGLGTTGTALRLWWAGLTAGAAACAALLCTALALARRAAYAGERDRPLPPAPRRAPPSSGGGPT